MERLDRLAMEQMAQDIEILKRQVQTLEDREEDLGRLLMSLREWYKRLNYRMHIWTSFVERLTQGRQSLGDRLEHD